jgi:hypothetical protein
MKTYKFKVVYSIQDEPHLSEDDSGLRSKTIRINAETEDDAWEDIEDEFNHDSISIDLLNPDLKTNL